MRMSSYKRGAVRVGATFLVAMVLAISSSSCSARTDMKGSLSSRVSAWAAASSFTARVAELQRDAKTIAKLAGENNQKGVRTLCEVMGIDARKANDSLPAPSEQLSSLLASAYSAIYKWAVSCYMESTEHRSGVMAAESAPEQSVLTELGRAIVAEKALALLGEGSPSRQQQ